MPSLFGTGKKTGGKYHELQQDGSDCDEFSLSDDERVLFRKSGEIELNLCPETRIKRVKHERSRCQIVVVLVSIIVVLISLIAVGVMLAKIYRGKSSEVKNIKPQTSQQETIDQQIIKEENGGWSVTYKEMASEGSVRLLDVDDDGIDDIIFASAAALREPFQQKEQAKTFDVLHKVCKSKGQDYPCMGNIIAVSGINGTQLWSMKTRSEVFVMNCKDFDINKDGKKDCVATGRTGQISAFDPYKGETLWSCEDDELFEAYWNTYHAAALPDWDNDSVPEVLIANGGDMSKEPDNHDRDPGRLVVLSGASGKPIRKRYLEMPNSKETYMSPVMFTPTEGGTTYILIGSGGETVPGDLMGISVRDFCHYILGGDAEVCGQSLADEYKGIDKDENGIFVIYRGKEKGVMVPPVVVDYDNDGVRDILMTSFEGVNNLYSGLDLHLIWSANFSGMETYGTPAPGYFNDDQYVDFMVTWNYGVWMEYYSVYVYVISGKDGSILWSLQSDFYQMSSSFSIASSLKHHDFFLFKVQGRDSKFKKTKEGFVRIDKEGRQRRHGNDQPDIRPPTAEWRRQKFYSGFNCDDDLTTYRGEVFVVDRDTVQSPYRVLEIPTKKHTYDAALTCSHKPSSGHTATFNHEGNTDNQDNKPANQDDDWQQNSEEIHHVDDHDDVHPDYNIDNNHNDNDNKNIDNKMEGNEDDNFDDDTDDNIDDNNNKNDKDDFDDDYIDDYDGKIMDDYVNDGVDDDTDDNKDISEAGTVKDDTGDKVNNEFNSTDKDLLSTHISEGGQIDSGSKDTISGRESPSHRSRREEKKGSKKMCSVEQPDSMSSGIIGDVDGDGYLDYISVTSAVTMMYDAEYCPQGMTAELTVKIVNLEKGLIGNIFKQVPVKVQTSMKNAAVKSPSLRQKTFLPMIKQRWTQYFGRGDNNVY